MGEIKMNYTTLESDLKFSPDKRNGALALGSKKMQVKFFFNTVSRPVKESLPLFLPRVSSSLIMIESKSPEFRIIAKFSRIVIPKIDKDNCANYIIFKHGSLFRFPKVILLVRLSLSAFEISAPFAKSGITDRKKFVGKWRQVKIRQIRFVRLCS